MSTAEEPRTQEQADRDEVIRLVLEGKKVTDPALRVRIRGRADRARQDILEAHGLVERAVDMVRDARDE